MIGRNTNLKRPFAMDYYEFPWKSGKSGNCGKTWRLFVSEFQKLLRTE